MLVTIPLFIKLITLGAIKYILFFVCSACITTAYSQSIFKKAIDLKPIQADSLAFIHRWDYTYYVKSRLADHEKVKKRDKKQHYYSANCATNLPNCDTVHYVFAYWKDDQMMLTFNPLNTLSDFNFNVFIRQDSFRIKPVNRAPMCGHNNIKEYFKVEEEHLVLDKSEYNKGDTIMGYIILQAKRVFSTYQLDTAWEEPIYLKGYFCTVMLKGKR